MIRSITIVMALLIVGIIWVLARGDSAPLAEVATRPTTWESNMNYETATFSAGCFWGVQSTFENVPGVVNTRVGYTGGHTANPSYRDVCTDTTGHAESIEIQFDPKKVTYQQLLDLFFDNHDPTTVDQQGPDVGTQYRSMIYYHSPEQEKLAEAEKAKRDKSGDYVGPIATGIEPAGPFYAAEEYHQYYFAKAGENWVCHSGTGKKPGR